MLEPSGTEDVTAAAPELTGYIREYIAANTPKM